MIDNITSIVGSEHNLALKSQAIGSSQSINDSVAKKEEMAKGFESLLIGKLLDEVQKTIGKYSIADDGAAKQVNGIFWQFLGQEMSENGGFGLWKDIYKSFERMEESNAITKTLDEKI